MSTQRLTTADQVAITRRALAIVQETGTDLETAVAQASNAHAHAAETIRIDYHEAYLQIDAQIARMRTLIKLLRTEMESFYAEVPCNWEPQKLMLYNPWQKDQYVESLDFSDFVDMHTDATGNVLHVLTRVKRIMERERKRGFREND